MHLKRLELVGFKTFADRTELAFGPGITAIVGPNGSGKSNLADAIRWVLGETSWRALRSQRTEDVIFAGTATRRAHGLAEVHLTVDNGDGLLPLEFSEITVSRRATRAGDSEFFLNRNPCRLRDIQNLFLGTGLGGRAYAMIGQGEVEAVLDASPAERRALLEEAAGLSRYKRRQSEAMRRLEHARQNLTRVVDRLAELAARRQELSEQAERARLYRDYQDRLHRAELSLQLEEYRRLRSHLRRVSGQLAAAQQRRAEAQAATEALERELVQARGRAQQARQALERAQAELVQTVEQAAGAEQEFKLLAQQASAAEQMRDRVRRELDRFLQERAEAEASLARIREEVARQEEAVEASGRELARAEAQLGAAEQELRQAQVAVHSAQADLMELEHARTQAQSFRAALLARRDSLDARQQALLAQLERLEQDRGEAEEQRRRLVEQARRVDSQLRETADALTLLVRRLEEVAQARASLEGARRELHLRRESQQARLAVLEEAQAELVGYDVAARRVLLAQRETPGRFVGIRGALVDYLDVDREHRAALEAALADRLFGLVVDSWDAARTLLGELESETVSLLVVEGVSEPPGPVQSIPEAPDGVAALASELVRCPPLVERLVAAALSDTLVVRDLDSALRLRSEGWGGRLVTLAGELLTPDGLLAIRRKGSSGPLGRVQEISSLRQSLLELDREDAELGQRVQELDREEESVRHEVRELQERVTLLTAQGQQVREELARVEALLASYPELEQEAKLELSQLRQQLADVHAEQARWEADLQRLATELGEARRVLEGARRRREEAEAAVQQASARLGALRVRHAELVAHSQAARTRIQELQAAQLSGQAAEERLRRELESAQADVERLQEAAKHAAQASEQLARRLQQLREAAETLASNREREEQASAELELKVASAQQTSRAAEEEVHRLEVRAAQVAAELRALERRIREMGGQDPQVLDAETPGRLDRDALVGEVESLRGLLAALGPVNPRALEEYQAVQDRYEALQAQAKDVEEAASLVAELGSRLESAVRQQFRDTVREVNEHFRDCFRRMFGGGSAALEIVTEDDGQEGVDVTAQLPGKKVRSLGALSGGERVMVALSLVFALLQTHPSPFCVFDEIEAALDDANTRRVVDLLQDLARRSQVVIITHNKATMEAADVLYGVTTQEPGVSSVVSVRITHAAREPAGVR